MGWLVTRQGETYIFQYGNTPRSVTFQSLAISLVEGKIKLEEFGKYVMTITFSQFDTIGGIVPTDISNAYDLIIGLTDGPYPVFNFDIGLFGTGIFDNYGIEDEATFITFLEDNGATNVVVTDFSLTSNRLRCGLTFDDMTTIQISGCILKIYDLSAFSPITQLFLDSNQISKIEGLSELINLTYLNLNINQISVIEGLDTLVNLTILDIIDNKISKIENIDLLVNLTGLYLDLNKIKRIENLNTLINLQSLTLSSNEISTVDNIDGLISLTTFQLEDNQLTTEEFDKMNSWAAIAPEDGAMLTLHNVDGFDNSTTFETLTDKNWSIIY